LERTWPCFSASITSDEAASGLKQLSAATPLNAREVSAMPNEPWLEALEEKERARLLERLGTLREAVSRLRAAASSEEPLSAVELERDDEPG
jgi:hypothetical protein